MKYALIPFLLASIATVQAKNDQAQSNVQLDSCSLQKDCIEFTAELLNSTNCPEENGSCEYKVCATMSFTGECAISGNGAKIKQSCAKPDDTCTDGEEAGLMPFSNPLVTKQEGLVDGMTQCQIVTGGMMAQFMFRDGGKCDGSAYDGYNLGNITALCGGSDDVSSCAGVNDGCVWRAMAPGCPDWDVRSASKQFDTCEAQNNCMNIEINLLNNSDTAAAGCDDDKEYYEVCAVFDFSKPLCGKRGAISHTCLYNGELCEAEQAFQNFNFRKMAAGGAFLEMAGEGTGYRQCQTIQAGGSAHFLFKDGNSCGTQSYSDPVTGAQCSPRDGETETCTGNGVGKECVWEIPVPQPTTKSPTASPTKSPTASPTKSPTASPTKSPTASPTKSPTDPVQVKADATTPSPTDKPTDSPVAAAAVTTPSPTQKPTDSPVAAATTASPTKTEFSRPGIPRNGSCMQTVYENASGTGELECAATVVSLDSVSASPSMTCVEGDEVYIDVNGTVHMSDTVYDFGWYIAADAGDALSGTCYTGYLADDSLDVTNGAVVCDGDLIGGIDECCDVTVNSGGGNINDLNLSSGTIKMTCADIDSDGFLDFSICFTWRDATTDATCDPSNMYPGGSTVCDCATYSLEDITVTKATTTHSTCI